MKLNIFILCQKITGHPTILEKKIVNIHLTNTQTNRGGSSNYKDIYIYIYIRIDI